jgi:hypothetical protein
MLILHYKIYADDTSNTQGIEHFGTVGREP